MRTSLAVAFFVLAVPATAYAQKRDASVAMNAATTDVAMFRYAQAAAGFAAIARDSSYADRDRTDAAINVVKLRAALGPREALRDAIATTARLPLAAEDRALVDYALADFDYRAWESKHAAGVDDPAARALALASASTFFSAHRRDTNRERLVETAYRISRVKRSAGEAANDWLRATIDAWAEVAATTAHPSARLASYAASAEIDRVMDEVEVSPLHLPKQCRYKTLSADAKVADDFDRRLDAVTTRYASALESVAEAEADRGEIFDGLRAGLRSCDGSQEPWWTSQARRDRDAAEVIATERAVRHYARALGIARARHASSAALQRAAQHYLALLYLAGEDAVRVVVEGTTSLVGANRLRFDEITATARGLAAIRPFRTTEWTSPMPTPP